jgi:CheY-like chemotaxis protein
MAHVLLVDDDPEALRTLGDQLQPEHEVEAVLGFPAAIARLFAGAPPDVVISSQDMPPYFGADLLTLVAARFPQTFRILLPQGCEPVEVADAVRLWQKLRRSA